MERGDVDHRARLVPVEREHVRADDRQVEKGGAARIANLELVDGGESDDVDVHQARDLVEVREAAARDEVRGGDDDDVADPVAPLEVPLDDVQKLYLRRGRKRRAEVSGVTALPAVGRNEGQADPEGKLQARPGRVRRLRPARVGVEIRHQVAAALDPAGGDTTGEGDDENRGEELSDENHDGLHTCRYGAV